MSPTLPGALIERERQCSICGDSTTAWTEAEITRGGRLETLCEQCADDLREVIANVRAWTNEQDAAESRAQEE